jgi:DNA-directed RNA polymerase specialized sigma24 family protein
MIQENEVARLRPELVKFAMQRLRNREQAEDAVQETFDAAAERRRPGIRAA